MSAYLKGRCFCTTETAIAACPQAVLDARLGAAKELTVNLKLRAGEHLVSC